MAQPQNALTAACLCSAVQLRVDEGGVKWAAYCHCTMCRRAHAVCPVAWVGVHATHFHVERGADVLRAFASSTPARRSFCSACGTPLLFQSEQWSGEVHIALGAVTVPHAITPRSHVFYDDRAPYVHVNDGLPKKGGPTGFTPLA